MKKLIPEFSAKYEMLVRYHGHDDDSHICMEHQADDSSRRKRGRRSVNEPSEQLEVYCIQAYKQILAEALEAYQQENCRRDELKENIPFTPITNKNRKIIESTPLCKVYGAPLDDDTTLMFTPIVSPPAKHSLSAFYTSSFLNDTCASSNLNSVNSYSLRTPDQNKSPYSVLFESPSFMLNFDASPQ